jgi:hypothetical protein
MAETSRACTVLARVVRIRSARSRAGNPEERSLVD